MHLNKFVAIGFSSLAVADLADGQMSGHLLARANPPAGPPPAGTTPPAGGPGAGGPGGPPSMDICYVPDASESSMLQAEPTYPPEIVSVVRQAPTPPALCGAPSVTGTLAAVATSVYGQIISWRDANSANILAMATKVDAACKGRGEVEYMQSFMACSPTAAGKSGKADKTGSSTAAGASAGTTAGTTAGASAATTSGPAAKTASGGASLPTAMAAGGFIACAVGMLAAL